MDALAAALIAVEEHEERLRGAIGPVGPDGKQGIRGSQGVRGIDGLPGADGEPGLRWRGTWSRGAAYLAGDVVEHDGSSYVTPTAISRIKPPGAPWDVLARAGRDGLDGADGRSYGAGASGSGGGLAGAAQTYSESNVTTDRAFNADQTTIDELADVLGTLIADLRARGVVA